MKPRLAVVAVLILVSTACGNGGDDEAATTTTTTTTIPTTTTTTLPPGLPPGDDTTVANVIDGDTVEVAGGTRVRLIGIDAPETTGGCFASEATAHTRELLPLGMRVRLAYDADRLDRFGRTLAYVYRLTDGLFVNLAIARDGFALQLTIPPNVAHAEEFGAAVAEARNAGRGLWAACQTTTTTRATAPTTTRAQRMTTTTAGSGGGAYYDNCDAARAAGAAPLSRGEPGYRPALDRDSDGVACE